MTNLKKKIPDYDLLTDIAGTSYFLINQNGIEYKVYVSNFMTTVVDNLTTESAISVLSASQGKELKRLLDYNTATRLLFNYESFWTITNDGNDVEVTIPAGEIRLPNDAAYDVATATGTIPEDGGLKLIFNPLSNSFSYSFLSASTLTGITEGETDNEYIIIKNIGGVLYTFNASLGLFINVISHNDLDGVNVAATDETAGHVDNTKPLQLPERTTTEEGTDTHNNGQIWFNKTLGRFGAWIGGSLQKVLLITDAAQDVEGEKTLLDDFFVKKNTGGIITAKSSNTNMLVNDIAGRYNFYKEDSSTGGAGIVGFMQSKAIDLGGTFNLEFGTGNVSDTNAKFIIKYDGNVSIEGETASTITSFDANKNLKSLPTTTYPSLAELALMKKSTTTYTSSATPTPKGSQYENELFITALAVNTVIAAPSGTAVNGNTLMIRIQDNGTARALAFNAIFEAVGVTLPTTTVVSKKMYIGCIYNSTDTKWDVVSVINEA